MWKWMIGSAVSVILAIAAWFATNYLGRPLLKFIDLRSEAHETIFRYANILSERPASLAHAEDGRAQLRQLGAKIDALRVVLPPPIGWCLSICRYDLRTAAEGLTGLSNSLGTHDSDTVWFRVQAQRALRLPIDPNEQKRVEVRKRLDGVPF